MYVDMEYFSKKKTFVSYLLCLLVVFRHTTSFPLYAPLPTVMNILYVFLRFSITPVAVPLFLILSGALFYRDYTPARYTEKLCRRVHTLLIPYLCWNTINLLLEIAETMLLGQFFNEHEKIIITPVNLLLGVIHHQYNSAFWFVCALFVFAVCAPVIEILTRNLYVGIGATAVMAVLAHYGRALPDWLISSQTSIVYYMVGALIGRFGWQWFARAGQNKKMRWCCNVVLILSAGISLYVDLQGWSFSTIVSEVFLIITALCFWVSMDTVALRRKKSYPDFMTHSFFLYALHMNLCKGFARVVYYVLPKHWIMAPLNFVLTILLLIGGVEIAVAVLKKTYSPLLQILTGSRAK